MVIGGAPSAGQHFLHRFAVAKSFEPITLRPLDSQQRKAG